MSRDSVLARGRAAAEAGMVDTCIVEAKTGTTTDRQTGDATTTYATVYSGKCQLKKGDALGERTTAGEGQVVILRPTLKLPIEGSEAVARGHRVTMTSCVHDPDTVGRQYTIRDEANQSAVTARRLILEEVT